MKNRTIKNKIFLLIFALVSSTPLWALSPDAPDKNWFISDVTFWLLIVVAAILFYVIFALSEVVIWSGKRKFEEKNESNKLLMFIGLISFMALSQDVSAQGVVENNTNNIWSSAYLPLYILITIEFFVIVFLTAILVQLTRKQKIVVQAHYENWLARKWAQLNYKVPIEREDEMLLNDHIYDGIQELDNGMPPWLKYIFIFTICFAIVYLWRYDFGNGLTQEEEYDRSVAKAKIELAVYLENASANYDENSVVVSTDAAVLAGGKNTFTQFCATCHGDLGEGQVGPNFTDDYWLHGGQINDIFRTISEGVPAKGMASWKEILTAKQIFEVANYIKSLKGTNPPNAKAPQGNLYVEGNTNVSDSLTAPIDSIKENDTMKVATN